MIRTLMIGVALMLAGCTAPASAPSPATSAPPASTTPPPPAPTPSPTHTFTVGEVKALAGSGYTPADPDAQDFVDKAHSLCDTFEGTEELDALTALMDASASKLRQVHDIAEYICEDDDLVALVEARQGGAIPDGDYYVGSKSGEIRAGVYKTLKGVTSGNCYWARFKKNDDIIDNDIVERAPGGVRITIRKSDYRVSMNDCGIWVPVK